MWDVYQKMLGPYQIVRYIGEGAASTVFEALDSRLNRSVALKVVHRSIFADAQEGHVRFMREARALAGLDHGNIISIYDVGEEGDYLYIVMELVDGPNLRQRLAATPPLSLRNVIDIAKEVCLGLHHAHENGIVHRDMKPANILLDMENNKVKVTDFGIALERDSTVTATSALIGTPHYMSPEQYDTPKVDGRSDIFSIGVILYEALTGQHPFSDDSSACVMRKIISGDAVKPSQLRPDIPEKLCDTVMRAMMKRPGDRYPTALEFAKALEQVAEECVEGQLEARMVPTREGNAGVDKVATHIGQVGSDSNVDMLNTPFPHVEDTEEEWGMGPTAMILLMVGLLAFLSIAFALWMIWPAI